MLLHLRMMGPLLVAGIALATFAPAAPKALLVPSLDISAKLRSEGDAQQIGASVPIVEVDFIPSFEDYGQELGNRIKRERPAIPSHMTPESIEEVRYSSSQISTLGQEMPQKVVTDLLPSSSVLRPTTLGHQGDHQQVTEYNPYQLFPPSFHDLLDIPIHVYKNGTEVRTLQKPPPASPVVSGGYANTQVQGYGVAAKTNPTYQPVQTQRTTRRTTTPRTTRRSTTRRTTTTRSLATKRGTADEIRFVTTTPRARIVTPGKSETVGFGEKVPSEDMRPVTVKPSHEWHDRFSAHSFGNSNNIAQSQPISTSPRTTQPEGGATRLSLYEKLKNRGRPGGLKARDRVPFIPRGTGAAKADQPSTTSQRTPHTTALISDNEEEQEQRDDTGEDEYYDEVIEYDDGYPSYSDLPDSQVLGFSEFGRRKDTAGHAATTGLVSTTTTEAAASPPALRQQQVYHVTPSATEPPSWHRNTPSYSRETNSVTSIRPSSRPDIIDLKTRKPWEGPRKKKPVFEKPPTETYTAAKLHKPPQVTTNKSPTQHGDHYHEGDLASSHSHELGQESQHNGPDSQNDENLEHDGAQRHEQNEEGFSQIDLEGGFRPQLSFPSPEETYSPQEHLHHQSKQKLPQSQGNTYPHSQQNLNVARPAITPQSSSQEAFQPVLSGTSQGSSIRVTESPNLQPGRGDGIEQLSGPKFNNQPARVQGFSGAQRRPGSGGFSGAPNRPRPGLQVHRPLPSRADGPRRPHRPFPHEKRPGAIDRRPLQRPRPRPTPAPASGGYLNSLLSWFRGGKEDSAFQYPTRNSPDQQASASISRVDTQPPPGDVQGQVTTNPVGSSYTRYASGASATSATYSDNNLPRYRPTGVGGASVAPSRTSGGQQQWRRATSDPLQRRRSDIQRRRGAADSSRVNTLQMMHPKLSRPSVPQVLRAPIPDGGYLIAEPIQKQKRRRYQRPQTLRRPSSSQMAPPSADTETSRYGGRPFTSSSQQPQQPIQDRVLLVVPTIRPATLLNDKRIMVVGPFVNPPPGAPRINYPEVLGSSTVSAAAPLRSHAGLTLRAGDSVAWNHGIPQSYESRKLKKPTAQQPPTEIRSPGLAAKRTVVGGKLKSKTKLKGIGLSSGSIPEKKADTPIQSTTTKDAEASSTRPTSTRKQLPQTVTISTLQNGGNLRSAARSPSSSTISPTSSAKTKPDGSSAGRRPPGENTPRLYSGFEPMLD